RSLRSRISRSATGPRRFGRARSRPGRRSRRARRGSARRKPRWRTRSETRGEARSRSARSARSRRRRAGPASSAAGAGALTGRTWSPGSVERGRSGAAFQPLGGLLRLGRVGEALQDLRVTLLGDVPDAELVSDVGALEEMLSGVGEEGGEERRRAV